MDRSLIDKYDAELIKVKARLWDLSNPGLEGHEITKMMKLKARIIDLEKRCEFLEKDLGRAIQKRNELNNKIKSLASA